MSFTVKLSSLTKEQRVQILKQYTVKPTKTQYDPTPSVYRCFDLDIPNDLLYLPMGLLYAMDDPFKGRKFNRMNKDVVFTQKLLTPETDPSKRNRNQVEVVDIALKRLQRKYTVFLACYTGMGKTAMIIYLTIHLKLKTVVLCLLSEVRQQWVKAYDKFSGGTVIVQFVSGTNATLDPKADVYIIGIKKASLMSREDFVNIGIVVVDEAHMHSVLCFTEVLFKIQPKYLIGSTATPDKAVAGYGLLRLYFGNEKHFIVRREVKNFTVHKIETNYKPVVEYVYRQGRSSPDWNLIVDTIEKNEERWNMIADLCLTHPDDKIIILCNRNCLAKGIYNILVEKGESVCLFIDKVKFRDESARILICGFKKGGVGLDDPNLTMGIIASDTRDIRQYEGRIRCTNNTIYHIVDNYCSFENHWEECREWYEQKGAKVIITANPYKIIKKASIAKRRYLKPNNTNV